MKCHTATCLDKKGDFVYTTGHPLPHGNGMYKVYRFFIYPFSQEYFLSPFSSKDKRDSYNHWMKDKTKARLCPEAQKAYNSYKKWYEKKYDSPLKMEGDWWTPVEKH